MASTVLRQYQEYLDKAAGLCVCDGPPNSGTTSSPPPSLCVGIIGAGMSGLYSALLLQRYFPGVKVKLFEASDRVGGTVYTHRFSLAPNQFVELGAMRLPQVEGHRPVFGLIDYLNSLFPDNPIELIQYNRYCPEGNRVFVNNTKQRDGKIMSAEYASKHYAELGFPDADGVASSLYAEALKPVTKALEENFEMALAKYKDMSVRYYLSHELGWSFQKINYVEVMCMQSNQFESGLLEHYFCSPGPSTTYKTINQGMSKLPDLCAEAVKRQHGSILLNAKVDSISQNDTVTRIGYLQPHSEELAYEDFDAVIVTIPTAFLRQIRERPYFGADKEHALRTAYYDGTSKLALRFHSRFWERTDLQHPPSFGGQSTTDLPIRWLVYPNYGMGKAEKGVLLVYNWDSDSTHWRLMSKKDKIKIALHNIQLLYPEVNVSKEYAGGKPGSEEYLNEAFEMDWWGWMFYKAGQFQRFFPALVRPHGNVYFAGGHLAASLAWIMSAVESARRVIRQLATKYGIETPIEYF